jgi:hypothetical protein
MVGLLARGTRPAIQGRYIEKLHNVPSSFTIRKFQIQLGLGLLAEISLSFSSVASAFSQLDERGPIQVRGGR